MIAVVALPVMLGITPPLTSILIGLLAVVLSAAFFGAFAIVLSAIVKSQETFNALFSLLLLLFMFVSSAFYPVASAPPVVQVVILLNPISHASDLLRFSLLAIGSPYIFWETIALLLESFLAFTLAVLSFNRIKI